MSGLLSTPQHNTEHSYNAKIFIIYGDMRAATPAMSRTKKELREAILDLIARVRKLKVRTEIDEATREWSDLWEEGPILLTTNKVRGREVLPELREMVKQLRQGNLIRLFQ